MRLFPIYFLPLLAVAALTLGAPAEANSGKALDLARIEAEGLESVGSDRLKQLVAQPKAEKKSVQFSRAWIDRQPKASGSDEWQCLAEALYFEARGETVKGQFAVAEVILNRVRSKRFPGTLCGVINQGTGKKYQCQFTYTCDGHKEVIAEPRAFARVGKVARAVLDGKAPRITDGATHYHTTAVSPNWSKVFTRTAKIGVHLFYREGVRTASN
ncbi:MULTISPECIES: cell wall hydrolase [unclassified Sulfitobacter]|jgi:spore germination cell wall hydrolase CwlJ-like protein|nr:MULTISPECIES: cell wall hydrolase [unclassified Sulfitobacter]MAM26317.1 cell wall hydrolase [Paracoccaceae bacterium]KZX94576.1 hydrolase [Sulfitobacter sp. HI0023]KZY22629.1 hydrolase [Sulfitobacter sp. HI0040]KZZ68391.1 hydrolase [Sulfitobacter sp. HI0129]MBO28835.1 cell wall hydrolase [Paracoccaceae bacterium]|tara:strand:- start:23 stop:664 length:642 start_codon:yes stop_codon:yes gene_type:complete